jgi:hypothetical protein
VTLPTQEEANEDFFRRSKPEWDSMGGHPAIKDLSKAKTNGVTHVTDVTPLPEAKAAPDGDRVLGEVHDFLAEFIVYPSVHAQIAHVLWIAHTHLMDLWESTPRLAFLSPEPGSGKTRGLEVTELLVPRPISAINATPAYLFRKVSDKEGSPTILFDEIDTVFGPKAKENEEVRGMLNAGHRRGAIAGRCVIRGKEVLTEDLPAYCAVAMAGLGGLPDTILSRAVIVRMRRRTHEERVKPFRRRVELEEGNRLRDRLAAWADSIREGLKGLWPELPAGIEDRDADVWEALLSVADAAGGQWPSIARVAAVALVAESKESSPSLGVRLLSDLRHVFGDQEALSTRAILDGLIALEESPWADIKGKPLDSRRLANYLRPYGVQSASIRESNTVVRGYRRESLFDPWRRYLPQSPKSATSATSVTSPFIT